MISAMRLTILPIVLIAGFIAPPSLKAAGCKASPSIEYKLLDGTLTHKVESDPTKPGLPKCAREGDTITFMVSQVNPLLYEGSINGTIVERHVDIPGVVQSAILGQTSTKKDEKKAGEDVAKRHSSTPLSFVGSPSDAFDEFRDDFLNLLHGITTKAGIEDALADVVFTSESQGPSEIKLSVKTAVSRFFEPPAPVDSGEIRLRAGDLIRKVELAYWQAHDWYTSHPDLSSTLKGAFEAMERTWTRYLEEKSKLRQKFDNAATTFQRVDSLTDDQFKISRTVQAEGDAISFSFEIKRRSGLPQTAITTRAMKCDDFFEVEVEGGIRVNFSTGLFFSNLTDESYVARAPKEGETPIIERRGEEEDVAATAGALIHVYKKGWRIPIAASFGAGTAGDNVSYYLGPSLLLGKTRRWVFTGGASLAKVKRLGGGLVVGDPYTGDNSNIPTDSKFRLGYFIGLTFNLNPPSKK